MGPEQAVIQAIAFGGSTLTKMVGQIGAGSAQQDAGMMQNLYNQQEADLIEQEGDIIFKDYINAAKQRTREVKEFRGRQLTQYAASGVTLEGTPLIMLERTRRLGQQEVDQLLRRGQRLKLLNQGKARNMRLAGANAASAGRSAMTGSVISALGTGLEGLTMASRLGMFGNKTAATVPATSGVPGVYTPDPLGPSYWDIGGLRT